MRSDESPFWDERFKHEGFIWGEAPSPTAQTAVAYLPANARVLEVGFGYGRDLVFLLRQGYQAWGVDFSAEARSQTEARLQREGLVAEGLLSGTFQESGCPDGQFDAVISHRMAHLLVTDEEVERFTDKAQRVLRPGGLLCLGVRNTDDRNPAEVRPIGKGVCEYMPRPGHLIRFWDDEALRKAFSKAFTFLAFDRVTENESLERPIPCHLTVMVAQKIDGARGDFPESTR